MRVNLEPNFCAFYCFESHINDGLTIPSHSFPDQPMMMVVNVESHIGGCSSLPKVQPWKTMK